MDNLELTIRLSGEYSADFDNARALTNLRNCRCWFDQNDVVGNEITVKLMQDTIILLYDTPAGPVKKSCAYGSVLSVTELSSGIMLRLPHKHLLFLPASGNALIPQAMIILKERCLYVFRHSRLQPGHIGLRSQLRFRLSSKQSFHGGTFFWNAAIVIFLILLILAGTVFITEPVRNRIIPSSEAVAVTAAYSGNDSSHGRYGLRYIDILFSDHEELSVAGSCCSSAFTEQLDSIAAGTELQLLVHPKSGYILQIDVNGATILDFDNSQSRLWRESLFFAALGILLYAAAIVIAMRAFRKSS